MRIILFQISFYFFLSSLTSIIAQLNKPERAWNEDETPKMCASTWMKTKNRTGEYFCWWSLTSPISLHERKNIFLLQITIFSSSLAHLADSTAFFSRVEEKKSSLSIVGVIQHSHSMYEVGQQPDSQHDRQVQCHNFLLLYCSTILSFKRHKLNSDTNLWQFSRWSVVRWLWKLIRLIVHKINMQLFLIRVISIALTQKSFKFNFFFLKLSFLWFYHKSQTIISSRETHRNENLKFKIFQLSVISHFSISHNWPTTRLTETSVDSLAISPKHWNRLVDFNLNVAHSWRS